MIKLGLNQMSQRLQNPFVAYLYIYRALYSKLC